MRNLNRRIDQAREILSEYNFDTPVIHFLKAFYRKNKKFGGRDRREINEIVFTYLRMGQLNKRCSFEQTAAWGYLLGGKADEQDQKKIDELIELTSPGSSPWDVLETKFGDDVYSHFLTGFPEQNTLEQKAWVKSLFAEKRTFIRILRNHEKVSQELEKAGLSFSQINDHCWSLSSDTKLTELENYQSGNFYVQDHASQSALDFFPNDLHSYWWDACAASGGKSLLMLERNPKLHINASDIRESTLSNYRSRLKKHGYRPNTQVIDLTNPNSIKYKKPFDGIVVDAPCSGSGTWSRSPEQLHLFDRAKLSDYVQLQTDIVSNAQRHLKPGGVLIYLTCSVFNAENEGITQHICQHFGFTVDKQSLIDSTKIGGDYLFAARLTKTT